MPRPLVWLFRGLPSPVPAQTKSGLTALNATAPMLWVGWSSNTGSQVTPALVLFHNPPEAVPTYTTSGESCGTAMDVTRPLIVPGPKCRTLMASTKASTGSASADVLDCDHDTFNEPSAQSARPTRERKCTFIFSISAIVHGEAARSGSGQTPFP